MPVECPDRGTNEPQQCSNASAEIQFYSLEIPSNGIILLMIWYEDIFSETRLAEIFYTLQCGRYI